LLCDKIGILHYFIKLVQESVFKLPDGSKVGTTAVRVSRCSIFSRLQRSGRADCFIASCMICFMWSVS